MCAPGLCAEGESRHVYLEGASTVNQPEAVRVFG